MEALHTTKNNVLRFAMTECQLPSYKGDILIVLLHTHVLDLNLQLLITASRGRLVREHSDSLHLHRVHVQQSYLSINDTTFLC